MKPGQIRILGLMSLSMAGLPAVADQTTLDAMIASLEGWAAEGAAAVERGFDDMNPLLVETAAPLLAGLIEDSRDAALAAGVEPIPAAIREQIAGYVPAEVLDRVRWCAGCGGELSLQSTTFRLGLSPAITLDHVIVFDDREEALFNPALWVHELRHVMQFAEWGLEEFAGRYISDYEAVEREAAEYRWEWVVLTGDLEKRKARQARREAQGEQ